MILYVATSNPGKLRDFAVAAKEMSVSIAPLPGLSEIPAPAEDAPTFDENARTKAEYYSRFAPGEIVIADDSGLEVSALDDAPGVRSARYAADAEFMADAPLSPDERNNLFLIENLKGVPRGQRAGRYRCALAAARDGACFLTADGSVEGEILATPRGDGGFGYDPLFYLPALSKTMAEIDPATKHDLSHRGRALRNLLSRMPSFS